MEGESDAVLTQQVCTIKKGPQEGGEQRWRDADYSLQSHISRLHIYMYCRQLY